MVFNSGFVGEGIPIMEELQKDLCNTKSLRVIIPITHLYLEHIFDLVLAAQWDKSSMVMSERSGYGEKIKLLYALKLIDDERFETLKTINNIRNEFAHSFNPDDKKIKKLTLKIHGHAWSEKKPWQDRYLDGAIDSMSVLCGFLR